MIARFLLHGGYRAIFMSQKKLFQLCHFISQQGDFILKEKKVMYFTRLKLHAFWKSVLSFIGFSDDHLRVNKIQEFSIWCMYSKNVCFFFFNLTILLIWNLINFMISLNRKLFYGKYMLFSLQMQNLHIFSFTWSSYCKTLLQSFMNSNQNKSTFSYPHSTDATNKNTLIFFKKPMQHWFWQLHLYLGFKNLT